ncbi:FliM/FliN family flagellar motor C-terminal domain-containing protein [Stutzerimonas stutzeri]|uniref:FliM/FliN family flagellar motor C-terminal domain-containing protein n=1 Tax=Stutzerimonas stutzeri TaxID=316 RepID=A0ABD4Y393_STUST|nr:FliM/FliN family flagellar motor C-terminal domain-containing protein [Stutzerimonas stutzeri]MDH0689645.1 FliM/FliN family flagellar motor C-terminal domain-containing protein [Stutzerimonas stutzeri]RRV54036.1 FliM/FliN family flagellar motor switch protein [Stutzerimonas stutzeri]RRV55003.1 FliM/FliN family flagellar motor switch protein [Stutzerimonas stutzeri]
MTGNAKVHHGVPAQSLTVLKPQKLGRHHHKIPQYIKESTNKNPRLIGDYFLRDYRINLELNRIDVQEERGEEPDCIYRSAMGKVGFSIDRALLTEALECYYGGTVIASQDTPPISTSEQRMRNRLGMDITDIFARSILSGETFGKLDSYRNDYEETSWEYVAEYEYISHITGSRSSIYLYLDTELVDELTSRLAGPPVPRLPGNPIDHIKHLPVRLDCVVAAAQMPLAQVLALQLDDILMLRPLDRYEVRINQQKLFRGTIFEEDGALFLTSLESVNPQ